MASLLKVKKDANIYIENTDSSPTNIYIDDTYVVSLTYDLTNLETPFTLKYIWLLNGTDTTWRADPATASDCTVYIGENRKDIISEIKFILWY